MPNRVVREGILSSERVNALSESEELFYRRLMSVVDDYGRYFAHPGLLRSACYPMRLDTKTEAQISEYLVSCQKAGLIRVYQIGSKSYLELVDFHQRMRQMKSKFPPREVDMLPTDNCQSIDGQLTALNPNPKQKERNPLTPLQGEVAAQAPQRAKSRAGPPNLEDLVSFCSGLGLPRTDAEYYDDHWKANGYRIGSNPVRDWKAVIRNHKRHGWLPSQQKTNNPGRSPPKQARL